MTDDDDGVVLAAEVRVLTALRSAVDEIKQAGRRESERLFAQVEALLWLRDMLGLERSLSPTRDWAVSPDLLLTVANHIVDAQPRTVVEMGSGTSSVVIAACLKRNGQGELVSVEHDPEHARVTRSALESHGLTNHARVLDAPLGDVLIAGESWRWYTIESGELPESIDMVLVDGPPGGTGPLARYPALPVLRSRLSETAAIFIDDAVRSDEKEIVARWAREDPTLRCRELLAEKGAWLLQRGV